MCNEVRNCKFGWDEESCGDKEGGVSLDFSSPTVFMILIVLILILMGMCAGMMLSFRRTLKEDAEEDEEEGEDNDGVDGGHSSADSPSLAVISNSNHKIGESTPRLPTSLPPSLHSKRPLPPHAHHDIYPSNDDSNAGSVFTVIFILLIKSCIVKNYGKYEPYFIILYTFDQNMQSLRLPSHTALFLFLYFSLP